MTAAICVTMHRSEILNDNKVAGMNKYKRAKMIAALQEKQGLAVYIQSVDEICDADGCLEVNGPWVAECHRCTPSGDPS